jgi:hypothetical protein
MRVRASAAVIDLAPRKRARVSFQKFVRMAKARRDDIASVEIIFPRLGSKGFGSVEVEYTHPMYESFGKRHSE